MADPKKRFSVGRHVLVGVGLRSAVVRNSDDKPSVMGEYAHVVRFDDNGEERRVLGCDMQPLPALDQDFQNTGAAIHIHNSNVANINLGSQVGRINVVLQKISTGDESQQELARALGDLAMQLLLRTCPITKSRK